MSKVVAVMLILSSLVTGGVARSVAALPHFESIRILGNVDVLLLQADSQSLRQEATESCTAKVHVDSGTLVIDATGCKERPRVFVSTPSLQEAEVTDNASLRSLNPFLTASLALSSSKNALIELSVKAEKIYSAIFGTGSIELRGSARTSAVTVSASGEFRGRALQTEQSAVVADAASLCDVNASSALFVEMSGQAELRYAGNPMRLAIHREASATVHPFATSLL